jgi:hypothetical protein
MTINLYQVSGGEAMQVGLGAECDGVNSVLVAAADEMQAIELAQRYDRGDLTAANLAGPALGFTNDVVVVCVYDHSR